MQTTLKNNNFIIKVHVVTAKSYCIEKRNGLHWSTQMYAIKLPQLNIFANKKRQKPTCK